MKRVMPIFVNGYDFELRFSSPSGFGLVFGKEDGEIRAWAQHESCRSMSWLYKETNFIIF